MEIDGGRVKPSGKNPIYGYVVAITGEPLLVTQSSDDRVMIFIDLGGVSRALEGRVQAGRRIDWFRLAKHLTGPRRLIGANVFDRAPASEPGNPKRRFHDHLRYSGFRVHVRTPRPDAQVQGETNVAIASQMMTGACRDRFDVAIVVTTDPDLVPVMERVSEEGKIVEVAGVSHELVPALRLVADRMHHIDDLPVLEILPTVMAQEAKDYMELQEPAHSTPAVSLAQSLEEDTEKEPKVGSDMPFAREV